MPKVGFKAITINGDSYQRLVDHYTNLKDNDKLPYGIHSFSGFVDYCLSKNIDEHQKLRRFASNIESVPMTFLDFKVKRSIK